MILYYSNGITHFTYLKSLDRIYFFIKLAKCATLYRKYRDREWILDDESYFTKTHSTINGNDNLY